ncbi:MAG: hypothetical protein ACO3ST_10495, partial [Burkholderiaceae bacterium]
VQLPIAHRGRAGHTEGVQERNPTMTLTTYLPAVRCPRAAAPALTDAQRLALLEYVQELTAEGKHLEASTLYAEYFPLV